MCGIVGFLDKRQGQDHPIGKTLLGMLEALGCRGPDSAGVAVFGPPWATWVLQVKLPDHQDPEASTRTLREALVKRAPVLRHEVVDVYLRLEVGAEVEPGDLEQHVLSSLAGAEVVSLGHSLEILKQVGSPQQLEKVHSICGRRGTHGIGHTRLSTESRVDLSHSQPFWAHGVPDLATVHNGHITNYHKLRRRYEQQGQRFFTENDSEVIGVYLRDRLSKGRSLEEALRSSLDDFDGSFSYLAATSDRLAYVRDRYGFKPLVVAETADFVAIATEEIALRQALGTDFTAREPAPGTMSLWSIPAVHAAVA